MRQLKTRVHPVTVLLALAILCLAIFIIYSRKLESESSQLGPEEMMMMQRPTPPPFYDPALQAMIKVSPEEKGDMVLAFRADGEPPPLARLGCKSGDVLVSINGQPVTGTNVERAMEDLEKHGKPIILIVKRGGQQVELKHTKMPASAPQGAPGASAPRSSSGQRGRSQSPPGTE